MGADDLDINSHKGDLWNEVERLRAALLLARPALAWYDGLRTVGCNVCDRELPPAGVGDCPHGDHCPVAASDALGAA